jgi:hypothetical protein
MGESQYVPNMGVASPLPDYHGHLPGVTHARQGLTQAVWMGDLPPVQTPLLKYPSQNLAPAESKLLCQNTFYTFVQ